MKLKAKAKCPSPQNLRQEGREKPGDLQESQEISRVGEIPQKREAKDKHRKSWASLY